MLLLPLVCLKDLLVQYCTVAGVGCFRLRLSNCEVHLIINVDNTLHFRNSSSFLINVRHMTAQDHSRMMT